MSCGHCVAAVSRALRELPGVTVGQVAVGGATVALDPRVASPQVVVAAIEEAGYGARVDGGAPTPA
jgi:copper chaperone CopZ